MSDSIRQLAEKVLELQAERDKQRKALKFYANENNWHDGRCIDAESGYSKGMPHYLDNGSRAREAQSEDKL